MANKTIFDIVTATDIGAYWEATLQEREPYVGEVLFPNKKKLGLDLEWINGNSGIPVVLNLSMMLFILLLVKQQMLRILKRLLLQ